MQCLVTILIWLTTGGWENTVKEQLDYKASVVLSFSSIEKII